MRPASIVCRLALLCLVVLVGTPMAAHVATVRPIAGVLVVLAGTPASDARASAEAALLGSGGLVGAFGAILTPADLVGMTGSELGLAIASGEIVTG